MILERSFIASVMALIAFVAIPLVLAQTFYIHLAILIGIQTILALSVYLMLKIGQLSLAQAGFMGIGAYASALLTRDAGVPFGIAFLMSGAIPAVIAGAIGPLLMRTKGVHFVLLTFALGEVIVLIFVEWTSLFGGNNGISAIPPATLFGLQLASPPNVLVFTALVLGIILLAMHLTFSGDLGVIVEGLERNEALQSSLGVNALAFRCLLFSLSAFIAGISGSLYAHYLTFISPEAFGFWTTVNALILNVIGGAQFLMGPFLGALALVPLPEVFREWVDYQRILYGVALLLLMRGLPQGVLGLILPRLGWGKGR